MALRNQKEPNHASTPEEEATILYDDSVDAAAGRAAESVLAPSDRDELAAIAMEIERLKESLAAIADASSHYVKRRVAENSTDLIAEYPLRAALGAALAGFLVGRLTR